MPNFSIPLSGLTAASQALAVISNNLANLNTVGFKESRASFTDLFYQAFGTNGANDPIQVGEGVALGSVTPTFTGGNLEGTGVPTDVAITGNGLFVTQKNGVEQYTRAGNFTVDAQGQLTTQDGQLVMGYPAVNGVISPSQTLAPLLISQGQLIPGAATTSIQTQTNLDASSAVGDSFSTPVTVFDSLGTSHVVTYQFTKTASNAWSYQTHSACRRYRRDGRAYGNFDGQRDFQSGRHPGYTRRARHWHRNYRIGGRRRGHYHDLESAGRGREFPAYPIVGSQRHCQYFPERLRQRNAVRLQHHL